MRVDDILKMFTTLVSTRINDLSSRINTTQGYTEADKTLSALMQSLESDLQPSVSTLPAALDSSITALLNIYAKYYYTNGFIDATQWYRLYKQSPPGGTTPTDT